MALTTDDLQAIDNLFSKRMDEKLESNNRKIFKAVGEIVREEIQDNNKKLFKAIDKLTDINNKTTDGKIANHESRYHSEIIR